MATGDDRANVRANRVTATEHLGRSPQSFVSVTQVHGHEVVQVTAHASPHIEADALITQDANATLAVLVADCVPIVMADATARTVAAIHAGWRGTQSRIAALGALGCARVAQCDMAQLWAHLGPAIGPCCFVVDAPVAEALQAAYPTVQDAWAPQSDNHKRFAIDLWALNVRALMDTGIPQGNITSTRQCTHCSPDYFSHRRDGAPNGRQGALIATAHQAHSA